jgi:DNA polymerase-3 subunit alpha
LSKEIYCGSNLGFDVIMGAELHRMGIDSPMATMPVLDTCTEVTAKLLQLPGRGGKFKFLPLRSCMNICLTNPFRSTMQLPMWRQQHVAFRAYSKRVFTKEELDVPASYFEDFQAKNPEKFNS